MTEQSFDVFLCHNSEDKPVVVNIAEQLQQYKLKPWLDEWELRPGLPWQPKLEEQISQIQSAAVFIGQEGIGPWQQQELQAFLREFVVRKCPVIPVLLPSAPSQPKLPIFLKGMMWVDFRQKDPDPTEQLIWGITGQKPQRLLQKSASQPSLPTTKSQPKLDNPPSPLNPKPQSASDNQPNSRSAPADCSPDESIDYSKLCTLLKLQEWRAADRETANRMCEVMGRQKEGYLRGEDVQNFPCQDLQTIDQLWVKYSNGHFGFSIQKKIWQECGSPTSQGKDWDRFCVKVGWQKRWLGLGDPNYVNYSALQFDSKRSPAGELPAKFFQEGSWVGWRLGGRRQYFFPHLQTCGL